VGFLSKNSGWKKEDLDEKFFVEQKSSQCKNQYDFFVIMEEEIPVTTQVLRRKGMMSKNCSQFASCLFDEKLS
jgi:hypothetical protein